MDAQTLTMIDAAKAGGAVLRQYFGQSLELTYKSSIVDYRTKADLESEAAILAILESAFPEYTIWSEERGELIKQSPMRFVIDPLDGTNNFVLGIPQFSVSIALLDGNRLVAGVIYHPILDTVYHAQRGQGAFRDGNQIHVSEETGYDRSSLVYTCAYATEKETKAKHMHAMDTHGAKRVLNNWAPTVDHCLLASGRIEAIVSNGTELYDFAAGKIIALEAGAKITDFSGNECADDTHNKFILSNGSAVHDELVAMFAA